MSTRQDFAPLKGLAALVEHVEQTKDKVGRGTRVEPTGPLDHLTEVDRLLVETTLPLYNLHANRDATGLLDAEVFNLVHNSTGTVSSTIAAVLFVVCRRGDADYLRKRLGEVGEAAQSLVDEMKVEHDAPCVILDRTCPDCATILRDALDGALRSLRYLLGERLVGDLMAVTSR